MITRLRPSPGRKTVTIRLNASPECPASRYVWNEGIPFSIRALWHWFGGVSAHYPGKVLERNCLEYYRVGHCGLGRSVSGLELLNAEANGDIPAQTTLLFLTLSAPVRG
jgi:hypothetical protein